MFIFNVSQKIVNTYQFKYDKEIPDIAENRLPLWNWYVKPYTINRKKYILFLERDHYLCLWAEGVTSKNITEVFREKLREVLNTAGIPLNKINELEIENRKSYISKTSDKVWIGVSNQVVLLSEQSLYKLESTTSGLRPLLLYEANTGIYGAPNYKTPEDEIRKLFGLEPRKTTWNQNSNQPHKNNYYSLKIF